MNCRRGHFLAFLPNFKVHAGRRDNSRCRRENIVQESLRNGKFGRFLGGCSGLRDKIERSECRRKTLRMLKQTRTMPSICCNLIKLREISYQSDVPELENEHQTVPARITKCKPEFFNVFSNLHKGILRCNYLTGIVSRSYKDQIALFRKPVSILKIIIAYAVFHCQTNTCKNRYI